jgi:uncharacterized membrane protein SpoIIM required for sporulation
MIGMDLKTELSKSLIITRRELRDGLRDWRIISPIVLLTLILPSLMNFVAGRAVAFVTNYGAPVIGERLIPFLLMIVGFFPSTVTLVIALVSFVGEKERFSLEPLLSAPLSNLQLYLGKTLASVVQSLVGAYLGIAVYLVGLYFNIGWRPPAVLLAQIVALTTVQALVMVSAAVILSTQATSTRASNLLSSFIIIPMALLVQGEAAVMFWARYDVLWVIIFGLVMIFAVLVRMGFKLINREELLGREIDDLNLRGAWRTFTAQFMGSAGGPPMRWFRVEVLGTVGRMRVPMMLMAGLVAAGFVIGFTYAPIYRLPPAIFDLSHVSVDLKARLEQFSLFTPQGVGLVFFQNFRAILLATALGIFSFGVVAAVIYMLPLGLAGYFAGQVALAGGNPWLFLLAFILPHGIAEISAILLVGGATLRLGASLIAPPPGRSVFEGWLIALADWCKIFLSLVLPLLIIAAILEVFLTPQIILMVLGSR